MSLFKQITHIRRFINYVVLRLIFAEMTGEEGGIKSALHTHAWAQI